MTSPRTALPHVVLALMLPSAWCAPCADGSWAWCRGDRPSCSVEQLTATHAGGVPFTVPYYSSIGDIEASSGEFADIEIALVVSHGAVADPGGYWCAGMEAAANLAHGIPADRIAVIAPWLLDEYARVSASPTQLQWSSSAAQPGGSARGWRGGANCDAAGGRPGNISSYHLFDIIFERLLQPSAFPRLRGIIMWGDSAGGQVVSRYALTTHLASSSLRRIRFFSSNPSSFPYPSALRYNYSFSGDTCKLGELALPDAATVEACPDYNNWIYGLGSGQPPYVAEGLARGGVERLPSVDVTYLQGSEDTCNEDGTCGTEPCRSGGLDRTCSGMLQGPMRLWRGVQYKAALEAHYGRPVHALLELPGVGHDAYQVVRSPHFIAAAFGGWGASRRAYRVPVAAHDPALRR